MLAMNNEGFPLFKRTCKICLLPRPWPKCQARTSLLVDRKLALRWTDISQGKGSVPLCRNDGEPSPYAEATPQSKTPPSGLLGGDPARAVGRAGGGGGAPPLGAQEVPPEWVSNCVYLLLAVLQEYIYSISCLSLLLTRDLFGSCPGLLGVGEQGGGLWEEVWEPKPSGAPGPPLDLNHPTTRGPHRPPGTLSAH